MNNKTKLFESKVVDVHDGGVHLSGNIYLASETKSWIIFAHGSGSSHKSVRNISVAEELARDGHSVLLFDLLTLDEDNYYHNRFDIPLLTSRLVMATKWLRNSQYYLSDTPIGYFGASTGSAAALTAAANTFINKSIYAIVSRGGRPDMVDRAILRSIEIPTLLIVGGSDGEVIKLNDKAQLSLSNSQKVIVPNATHLFEEPGALEEVIGYALNWYNDHLSDYLHKQQIPKQSLNEMGLGF